MRFIRQILHALVAIAAWAVFALMWYWAFRNSGPAASQIQALVLVVVLGLLVVAVTGLWVAYNVRIWKRGDRREMPQPVERDYSVDACGRQVLGGFADLRERRYIEISVAQTPEGSVKHYVAPGREQPTEEEAASCVA